MTEQEYADLTAACDRLLRAPDTSLERVAIPMLHVTSEHPGCLRRYQGLHGAPPPDDEPAAPAAPGSGRTRAARALRRLLRPAVGSTPVAASTPGVDVLIVSHLSSAARPGREDDFYFGGLQRLLRERGASSALLPIDHLAAAVSPRIEWSIWRRCAIAWQRLRHAARDSGRPLDRAVALLASRHALTGGTAANLRLHATVRAACARLRPGIVIATYEGEACERMIWHAARSQGRQALCVGYQHTRLLQRAHAIRRCVEAPGIRCDPDVVLTLGEIPHATLAASPGLREVRLIRYGTHRRAQLPPRAPGADRAQRCLVLPDGDERECAILLAFAAACARRMPQMTFLVRPHPLTDVAALRARHGALRALPANVSLSAGGTLEEHCAQARCCLYRGSSAVIQAVLSGVRPFYVARRGELPFDLLGALAGWRETVGSPEEFALRQAEGATGADSAAARHARDFCDRYASPVRPAALDELLDLRRRQAS